LTDLEGQLHTTLKERASVLGRLTKHDELEPADHRALQTEELELRAKLAVLQEKIRLQKEREKQLIVRSPIDGVVVSWDVEKTLRSRPITTGQVLMEIADLSDPMYLELELPEKREGHLDQYIRQQEFDAETDSLDVTYILASDPDEKLKAQLRIDSISMRAEADEEHGATIKMHADPIQADLRQLSPRPGTGLTADIHCGRRSSGFVFLHEIYEWCCKFFF
jgi:hypothetical protein